MPELFRAVAVNAAFYGVLLAGSILLLRFAGGGAGGGAPLRIGRRALLWALAGFWAFYFVTGLYFTAKAGAHSGDEGHFMIQAESLWNDHDLDIRNNLYAGRVQRYAMREYGRPDAEPDVRKLKRWYHVSERSRAPHWYSWHTPGLSFVLAPVFPLGNWGRQLVLGLIASLSVCGLLKLCERFGAGARSAILITALFSASVWWGIYAVRALPEVLGAGLVAWMMTGVLMERGSGWKAVALVSACAAALPWAYVRFVPLGLMGFGFLWLRCLVLEEPRGRRVAMAAASAAIGAAAFGFYFAVQYAMFGGGLASSAGERLFTWPTGMWLMMSDRRGIGYAFPAAGWLVLSALLLSIGDAGNRRRSLALLSLFAAVLATSCGWQEWHGGACVPGRYIVAVLPLLLAPAAVVFDRQGTIGRWWLIALLLFSTMHFALVLAAMPAIGAHFAFPTRALRLFTPWARGLVNGFDFAGPGPVHSLAIAFYALTAAVLFLGRRAQGLQAALIAALIAAMALASWPMGTR